MEAGFLELIDEKKWQVIQNYFSEVIGTGVRVIDPNGGPLTVVSNPHKYCFENVSSSPKAFYKCRDCLVFSPKPMSQDKLLNNPQFFIDALKNIQDENINLELMGSDKPGVIRSDNYIYLALPMRI